jgi:hypothetical protein
LKKKDIKMISFADHAKQFLGVQNPPRQAIDSMPIDDSSLVDYRSNDCGCDAVQLTPEQLTQLKSKTNYRPTKSVVGSVTPEQKKRVAELYKQHQKEMEQFQGLKKNPEMQAKLGKGQIEDLTEEEFSEFQTLMNEFLEEEHSEPEHSDSSSAESGAMRQLASEDEDHQKD